MEPLISFTKIPRPARKVTWNTCLLGFILSMQFAIFVILLTIVFSIAPIVPDVMKVLETVSTTLDDVTTMLPQMNKTIHELDHIIPGIRKTIFYTESICKHTSGCIGYK